MTVQSAPPTSSRPPEAESGVARELGERPRRRIGFASPIYNVAVFVLAVVFVALVVYPIVRMVGRTFFAEGAFDPDVITRTFTNPQFLPAALNTLYVVGAAAILALLLATIFAWLNERTDARMGWAATLFPVLPLLLPPIVLSIGWIFLGNKQAGLLNILLRTVMHWFGSSITDGPVNIATVPGLIFVYVLFLLPYAYLTISAAVRNIDPALEEASRVCGAGLIRTFRKVTAPAIMPALGSAFLLMLIVGISGYSMAATIGVAARTDLLSVHLIRLVQSYPSHIDQATTIGLAVLVVLGAAWFLQKRLAHGEHSAQIAGRASRSLIRLSGWRWAARSAIVLYLLAASVIPLLTVLLVALQRYWSPDIDWSGLSFKNFADLFTGVSVAKRALQNSLLLGLTGATIGIAIATVLSLYAHRVRGWRGGVVDGVMKAPGAISHIVLGVAFIVAFAGAPFYYGGTVVILLLAYLVMYMPQASLAADTGVAQIPKDLVEASAMAGASQGRTVRRIVVPLILPALGAGWAMLFLVMVGDLTASALLSTTRSPVVGYVILEIWNNGTFAPLAALGAVLGLISAVVVGGVLYFSRKAR